MNESKEIYLLYGYYSDKSGGMIFGVYDSPAAANDRREIAEKAGAQYQMRVVGLIVNQLCPKELFV